MKPEHIIILIAVCVLWFLIAVFVYRCIGNCSRATPKPNRKERERIEAHRNKSTLIIKEGTLAKDETQVQYFATGKGFVNESKL